MKKQGFLKILSIIFLFLFCYFLFMNDGTYRINEEEEEELVENQCKKNVNSLDSAYYFTPSQKEISELQERLFCVAKNEANLYSNPLIEKPLLPPEC